MRRSRLAAWAGPAILLTLCSVAAGAGYSPVPERSPTPQQERRLVQSFFDLRRGRLDDAVRNAAFLVKQQPDFQLAQLVYADLLRALTGPLPDFGHGYRPELVRGHLDEARARLARYMAAPPTASVPESLVLLPERVPAAIVVDLATFRLYLFENRQGRFVRSRDFYVSIGKAGFAKRREGDEKTPIGVYLIDAFLPGENLPDLYGSGAFPLNYPNGWDRARGRTGSGIWIHGTDSESYSRPPLSSQGCVSMSNEDFAVLQSRIKVGRTPVIVTDGIRWVEPRAIKAARAELGTAVEHWRRDWESRDVERYLSHYAPEFTADGMSREAFAQHKRRVNAAKSFIRVELDAVSAFRYPGERETVLVDFVQRYRSNNYTGVKRKHQYWQRRRGGWRIVLEEGL